jgi:FHA domain
MCPEAVIDQRRTAMPKFTLIPQQGAGRGRLVRVGNTVLYSAGDEAAASALIGWCRLAGDRPAAEVLGELSRLASGSKSLGPFCAVVIGDEGLDVLSRGGVPLKAHLSNGERALSDGETHLASVTALDLLFGDATIDPLLGLTDGVVAADGFSLRVVSARTPWDAPSTAPGRAAEAAAAMSLAKAAAAPSASDTRDQPRPMPLEFADTGVVSLAAGGASRADAAQTRTDPRSVTVKGLAWPRGHFNDPRARFCASCGAEMHQTSVLTEDVRPPLGVLVMSDGSYHTLVTSLIFGRDPDDDPEVRSGRAQGVTLIDPGNTISRVHAEVRAVDWDVHLIDHGSTNGTFVWSTERQQWDRLIPRQPVVLKPGTHLAFGRMTATYESSNR